MTVFRRDTGHLQVGCNPGIVIPDRPGLYAFLRHLDGVRDVDALRRQAAQAFPELESDVDEVVGPLLAAGILVDADAQSKGPLPTVGLRYDPLAGGFAATVASALTELGCGVGADPDVTVLLSTGEPRRRTLAGMVRSAMPHLCAVLDGESVRIGPWVVPGHSPCVECLDLHRAAWDPAWSALVPQFGRPPHASGVPAHVLLAAAAVVVAEIASFAGDTLPLTSSSVLLVGPSLEVRAIADSAFHPRCSCSVLLAA
jgi:hypothetical protein